MNRPTESAASKRLRDKKWRKRRRARRARFWRLREVAAGLADDLADEDGLRKC